MSESSEDCHRYVVHPRVEILATSQQDAHDTLCEIVDRLFGEEHVVVIVTPSPEEIHRG